MGRRFTLFSALLLALSVCAFGQVLDPNVGVFDPAAACAPTCGVHPNPIPLTQFGVWNFGNAGEEALPWYLIFAVPNNTGGAPTLSDAGNIPAFTASGPTDVGSWGSGSKQTLYEFAGPSTALTAAVIAAANNSMNTANMFGAAELAAFGSTPSAFEVYLFSLSGALPHQKAEFFNTSIVAGTFVAVLGGSVDSKGHEHVYNSPFTTAGLGGSSSTTTTTTTTVGETASAGSNGQVPEPNGIVLLGSVLLAVGAGLWKRFIRS
jgi:hypothetical protein